MMESRRSSKTRGFTIVETLVALGLGSMVITMVLSFLAHTTTVFKRAEERLDPREEACRVMTALRSALTDCWHYQIPKKGDLIRFESSRMEGEIRLEKASGKLVLESKGKTRSVQVLSTGLSRFKIRPNPDRGLLQIDMEIRRPESKGLLKALAPLEISDEILAPAIGLKHKTMMIPWNRGLEREPKRPKGHKGHHGHKGPKEQPSGEPPPFPPDGDSDAGRGGRPPPDGRDRPEARPRRDGSRPPPQGAKARPPNDGSRTPPEGRGSSTSEWKE